MKVFFTLFVICIFSSALTADNIVPADNQMVAFWRFDKIEQGKIKDLSSNNNEGGVIRSGAAKKMLFDGKTYVSCPNNNSFNINDKFSLEVVMKISSDDITLGKYYTIISKLTPKIYTGWALYYAGFNNCFGFRFQDKNKKNYAMWVSPKRILDKWTHIIITYADGVMKFYIDGKIVKSTKVKAKISVNKRSLTIGRLYDNAGSKLKGNIEEIKIYKRALSAKEIKENCSKKKIKTVSKAPLKLKVIDYPESMYVKNLISDSGTSDNWLDSARAINWKIPRNLTSQHAEQIVQKLKKLGINVVFPEGYRYLFGNKNSPKSWWNGMPWEDFINTLKTFTEAAHKHNIKVVGHLTGLVVQKNYFKKNQNQAVVDSSTGKPVYYPRYQTYLMDPFHPGFRKIYFKKIEELVTETKLDGLMVDEVQWLPLKYTVPGSRSALKAFKEKYGQDAPSPSNKAVWKNWQNPLWRQWVQFRIESIGDFHKKLQSILSRNASSRSIYTGCFCNALNPITIKTGADLEDKMRSMDISFYEAEPPNPWSWRYNFAAAKYYSAFGPAFFLGYSGSISQQYFVWAFGLTNGFRPWIWPQAFKISPIPLNWEKKWEKVFVCRKTLSNIAIVFSSAGKNLLGKYSSAMEEYTGWAEALIEEHIPFDTITAKQLTNRKLSKYKTLILPDAACLSKREMKVLKNFVKEGGYLIASDETSLYDEKGNKRKNFGLNELFGVDYLGSISSKKIRFNKSVLKYKSSFKKIRKNSQTSTLATIEEMNTPAITKNVYGKGKAVYISFRPGIYYFMPRVGRGKIGNGGYWADDRKPAYKELMISLLRKQRLPLKVKNIPDEIIVNPFIYENDGYKGVVVHLLNCLGTRFKKYCSTPGDIRYEFLDYPSPRKFIKKDAEIILTLKRKNINKAYLLSPDFKEVVKLEVRKDSSDSCDIIIPDIGRYEVIYIVEGEKDLISDIMQQDNEKVINKFPEIEPFKTKLATIKLKKGGKQKRTPLFIKAKNFILIHSRQLFKNYNWNIKNGKAKNAACIYGKKTNLSEIKGNFYLDKIPEYVIMEVCALDDDSKKKCKIEICINGHAVFSGENNFSVDQWSKKNFKINKNFLLKGKNQVLFRNLENSSKLGAPWFLVNYARIKLK